MEVGRNQPCPCGSGRKYKQRHLERQSEAAPEGGLWRQVHSLVPRMTKDLLHFLRASYGVSLLEDAWFEFTLGAEKTFDSESRQVAVFLPRFFYEWVPSTARPGLSLTEVHHFPLAAAYLRINRRIENTLTVSYLEAAGAAAFSFHDVVTVSPGEGFVLRDALTGQVATVVERSASRMVPRGNILFAKVVSLDGLAVLDGCSPLSFPPLVKADVIDLRKRIAPQRTAITPELIRSQSGAVLEQYHQTTERLLNSAPPVFQNTAGDPLLFCRVTYEVPSAQAAFDALHSLSPGQTASDLLVGATKDESGQVGAAELPWLKKGNANHDWQNTVLGRIQIDGTRVVAETNSERRAEHFRELADELFPKGSRYLSTVLESIEAALEANGHAPPPLGEQSDPLDQRPELRGVLEEQMRAHYRDWVRMKVPALQDRTPLQAMRSKDGREMVEALLLDLEQEVNRTPGLTREIISELRATLHATVKG